MTVTEGEEVILPGSFDGFRARIVRVYLRDKASSMTHWPDRPVPPKTAM